MHKGRTARAGQVEIREIQNDLQKWPPSKYIITEMNLTAIERACLSEIIGPANAGPPDPLRRLCVLYSESSEQCHHQMTIRTYNNNNNNNNNNNSEATSAQKYTKPALWLKTLL